MPNRSIGRRGAVIICKVLDALQVLMRPPFCWRDKFWTLSAPALNYSVEATVLSMKRIIVKKDKFDAVLSQLLKTKPLPMKQVKTAGRRTSKSVIPAQSKS